VHSLFLARARVVYFHAPVDIGLPGNLNDDLIFGVHTSYLPIRFDIVHGTSADLLAVFYCPDSISVAMLIFLAPEPSLHISIRLGSVVEHSFSLRPVPQPWSLFITCRCFPSAISSQLAGGTKHAS
jgi:hypothetical protein